MENDKDLELENEIFAESVKLETNQLMTDKKLNFEDASSLCTEAFNNSAHPLHNEVKLSIYQIMFHQVIKRICNP